MFSQEPATNPTVPIGLLAFMLGFGDQVGQPLILIWPTLPVSPAAFPLNTSSANCSIFTYFLGITNPPIVVFILQ